MNQSITEDDWLQIKKGVKETREITEDQERNKVKSKPAGR